MSEFGFIRRMSGNEWNELNEQGGIKVEMKNPIKEADAHPEIRHLSLWRTELTYAWVINCESGIQDDMHYHENDDHIFMVLRASAQYAHHTKNSCSSNTTR